MTREIIIFNDHITHAPIKEEEIQILKEFNIKYIGRDCTSEEDFIMYAKDVDIIFDQGRSQITRKVIESLPRLKAILRRGIGYDNVDIKAATENEISVSNTPGYCADEVSTHAVALLLSYIRKIPKWHNWIIEGKWEKDTVNPYEGLDSILGENIGIIGFGNIGIKIFEKLIPYKPNFFIYDIIDPIIKLKTYPELKDRYFFKNVPFGELLKKSKYIVLACPLTKETNHLLDEDQFKMMRDDTIIINVGRGELINERVLIEYLTRKKIGGAALDVFEDEPIKSSSPLLKLKNVILSPHNAGISSKADELSFKMSFEEMIRIATGKKLKFRVN